MSSTARRALLLTATVRPHPGVTNLSLREPAERLEQYAQSLAYALQHYRSIDTITFAENSGVGLGDLEAIARAGAHGVPCELLDCRSDFDGSFGKGFGEFEMVRAAMERSARLGAAATVVKLTGLQRVENLDALLDDLPADTRFAVDLRDTRLFERFGVPAAGRWCDFRLLAFSPGFFAGSMASLGRDHRAGAFDLEGAMYHLAKSVEGQPGVSLRWRREPKFRGKAGHWGKDYGSVPVRLRRGVRAALRRLAPWLRI